MPDNMRETAGDTGGGKTEGPQQHPWARFVIDKAIGAVVAGIAAAFVVGFQYHTIKTDVAGAVETANEARGLAIAGQRAYRKFKDEVRVEISAIRADVEKQTNILRGSFSKQFGVMAEKFDLRFDGIDKFTTRMDEAIKWMMQEQRKDSQRMREEWRDWTQRNGK